MSSRVILDLCGGTGAWSKPYKEAGYDVRLITLPQWDVRYYYPFDRAYGVLAAPPCTVFSLANHKKRAGEEWKEALDVLYACLRIIDQSNPVFWCLENPAHGRMREYLGKPKMTFHPCDYGDPYTKKTALWGTFHEPVKKPVYARFGQWTDVVRKPEERAITPAGFARAFFEANHAQ